MLTHTFRHVRGIGPSLESALWARGVRGWDDVGPDRPEALTPARFAAVGEELARSRSEVKKRNARYFQDLLPSRDDWRLFGEFRGETAYLDIETTGLEPEWNEITTVALYDGKTVMTFVSGIDLEGLPAALADYRMIVTYNGRCFDVPFIEKAFRIGVGHAHLDLRYILKRLGYSGGLKGCERKLGVGRKGVEDVDGFMAVLLWQEYRRGNRKALDTLLAYNAADAVNLEALMVKAYNMCLADTPFREETLPAPREACIPFEPDPQTLRRLQASMPW